MKNTRPCVHLFRRLLIAVFATTLTVSIFAGPLEELHEANESEARLDLDLVYQVFNDAILTHRMLDPALDELRDIGENTDLSARTRAKSYLSMAHLYWRYGHFDSAIEVADKAIELEETTDGTLLKARLLDAQGQRGDAVEWYQKTLELTELPEEQKFIRIRLAMIDVQPTNVEALISLATEEDQEFKNRAALTLAVLGHPTDAVDLYQPNPESKYYFRQLLRITEWAILCEDYELAQENAWRAYETAETRFDALYALTLVDEAYRKADSLEELLVALNEKQDKDRDLTDLNIDLLSDSERYDEAIALFQSMNANPEDLSTRYRLLQIYDVARRTDEMVSEYRRLIREEPDTVLWYSGLASHFVSVAQPEESLKVWHLLEENNSDNIDVLTHGGRYMSQMGFEEEAMAIVERHGETHGPTTTGQIFLFEAHLANGRYDEATAELEELTEALPENSGDLRTVADAYERLQRFDLALDVFVKVRESEEGELGYDDRMRLAWLESVAGNREEAMRLWQDIWVREDTPARRKFAEAQFLLLAAELNKLATIAIDIERKLYNQEADKNEINLLVRIYTQVGDAFSAGEVIEEFAKYTDMSEIERLRQVGLVYLQLNEYDKYDKVLRELVEIDEENRMEHIQNIVLNAVAYTVNEESEDRLEDIFHWLEELRKYDHDAVAGEFEASVLSMSGFTEEAIESYRLALVQQPENSDNMLLMGELLKESDRQNEAVAIFQYIAEHAKNDNEFVVAIDGILNMIGQQGWGQRLGYNRQAVFKWAHRIILERITQREDKFYLYSLLSEIATEFLDTESEFVAIENSISQAGIRRLSVLRELVTMSTPGQGYFYYGRSVNDPDRQITYGRRLIGLRQQLPPEVYISIAKTLLSQDDQLGAEKALDLIQDITGDLDVNQTKADLFQEAGFYKKALAFYSHALALNQNNLLLLIKTAALREGNGQDEVAADLYMKGMLNVLRSQPAQLYAGVPVSGSSMGWGGPQNTSVNRDYNTYYEPLIQGLIATWPSDPVKSEQQFEALHEFFVDELEYIQTLPEREEGMQITSFSRLDYFCRFVRRLCSVLEHVEFAHAMDLELASVFLKETSEESDADSDEGEGEVDATVSSAISMIQSMGATMGVAIPIPGNITSLIAAELGVEVSGSEGFVDYLRGEYEANGLYMSDELEELLGDDSEEIATDSDEDTDLLSEELDKAIDAKDVERTARLLNVVEPSKPVAQIFYEFLDEPEMDESIPSPFNRGMFSMANPRDVLGYARSILGEREYVRMVPVITGKLQGEPAQLLGMIMSNPELVAQLEEVVGPFFRDFDEIKVILEDPDNMAMRQDLHYSMSGLWRYIQSRDNPNDSVEFYQYVVDSIPADPPPYQSHVYPMSEVHKELVKLDLNGSQRRSLQAAALDLVKSIDFQDEYVLNAVWQLVAIFDAHPDNLDVLVKVYEAVNERLPQDWKLGEILTAYYEGSKQEAFQSLLDLDLGGNLVWEVRNVIGNLFQEEILALIQQVIDGECLSEELTAKLDEIAHYGFNSLGNDRQAYEALARDYARGLMRCFPEDTSHEIELLMSAIYDDDAEEVRSLFSSVYSRDKSNESIRTAFFFWNKQREFYVDALNIATDGGPDLRNQEILEDIIARNAENVRSGGTENYILQQMIPIELRPTDEFAPPPIVEQLPKNVARAATKIGELSETATHADAAEAVRLFWRNINLRNLDNSSPFGMGGSNTLMFLDWPVDFEESGHINFYGYGYYGQGPVAVNWSSYIGLSDVQYGPRTDYERLLDRTIKTFPLGRELELLLRSQNNPYDPYQYRYFYGSQTDEKSRWYEVIRAAYGHHPEDLQQRLQELTDKILTGLANEHEFMMWMHLSNESQTQPSTEVITKFEEWAGGIDTPTQPQLVNIARFFAGLEEWGHAIEVYKLLVVNRADFNEFQGGRYYGPSSNQPLSLALIFEDVIEWLPSDESKKFIRDVLPVVQRFDDMEIGQFMSDLFNIEVLAKVFPPEEIFELASEIRASTTLPSNHNTPLKPFEALPLIAGIEILIDASEYNDALGRIQQLISKESIASSSDSGDISMVRFSPFGSLNDFYYLDNLVREFSSSLGISVPRLQNNSNDGFNSSAQLLFAMHDRLFDFENETWMDRLTDGLAQLLDDESVEQTTVIELLAVLYNEFYKLEKFERSSALAARLSQWLTDNLETLSETNVAPFAYLAIQAEFSLTPTLFSKMLRIGYFSTEQRITLIQKLRETNSPEEIFLAIQEIPVDTSGLSMLKELREVGALANKEEFVSDLDARIEVLQTALATLEIRVL
ncbi:MAG: hypothetical protein F4W92_04320 [Gammaproteobacteria bacterium]|nr:hypothetical protein [Gammaproteobacteria bacterium]